MNPNQPPAAVVSIVMAVCNDADVVDRTLQSLQGEETADVEVIVVNDGSSTDTADLLDRWQIAARNRRVAHQPNQGLTASLITGCRLASGRYIARQDAGDVSLPGRLSRLQGPFPRRPARGQPVSAEAEQVRRRAHHL